VVAGRHEYIDGQEVFFGALPKHLAIADDGID
jgi:hypothetical protein